MPPRIHAALLSAALLATGCGGGETRTPVYPASGTILLAGKPLAGAVIQFHPVNAPPGARADDPASATRVAEADDAGKFALSTYEGGDGAPAGDYVVTVRPGGGPSVEESGGPMRAPRPSPSLAKYAMKETSPLKATVKPDAPPTLAFDLK